jgi:ribosomal protein L32
MSTNELRDPGFELVFSCDAIDVTPQAIDWSEAMGENMEGWTSFECSQCEGCSRWVTSNTTGQTEHNCIEPTIPDEDDNDIDNECDVTIHNEGPQMNYWYPVKLNDCMKAAGLIKHLPLCVVEFEDGRTGLALTGGGMDLSWEICEAFIALGYFPPLHFCDLPRMGSRGQSDKDRATIDACRESCRIAKGWAADKRDRLTLLRAETLPVVVCDECGKTNRHHHSCSKYDESKRNDVLR